MTNLNLYPIKGKYVPGVIALTDQQKTHVENLPDFLPKEIPINESWRQAQPIELSCGHTLKFRSPVPVVGEEVYCGRCTRYKVVK